MRVAVIAGVMAITLWGVGCTEVRSGQSASTVESSAARALVSQLGTVATIPVAADELLLAVDTRSILALLPSPVAPDIPTIGDYSASFAGLDGCVIATDTSATFNECEIADHFIEGTWSTQAQRIHSELVDVFVAGPEQHGSVSLAASLTRRNSSKSGLISGPLTISGSVELSVAWTTESTEHVLDATVRITDLSIDTSAAGAGCATAGTIVVSGRIGDASFGDMALGTTTLWFGPGCRDIQISR